jgi:hypothetical protein
MIRIIMHDDWAERRFAMITFIDVRDRDTSNASCTYDEATERHRLPAIPKTHKGTNKSGFNRTMLPQYVVICNL